MEAATVPEAPVGSQLKTMYLENVSPDTQIVSDLGKEGVWASKHDKWDTNIRPIDRQLAQNSMGIQLLIAQGILVEVSFDEMKERMLEKSAGRQVLANAAGSKPVFEGNLEGEDITPPQFATPAPGADPEIDTSQEVEDVIEDQ